MALPIYSIPAVPINSVDFRPVLPKDMNRMEGRFTEQRRFGTPYWTANFRVPWIEDYGQIEAFFLRLDDGGVFRAYDPERPRPRAHDNRAPLSGVKAGGGAFDGTADLNAITNATTLVVHGLPALFQLKQSDLVEIRETEYIISLHKIDADVQANSSGEVTITIRPGLDTQNFTTAAVVNFEKPSCLMQLLDWSMPKSQEDRSATFSGEETFFYEPEED
jgi:hypothetical protein